MRFVRFLCQENVAKTEFTVIGSNQRVQSFSDDQINIEIDANLITKVKEAQSLGVILAEHLSWSNHIDALSKKKIFSYRRPKTHKTIHLRAHCPPNLSSVEVLTAL